MKMINNKKSLSSKVIFILFEYILPIISGILVMVSVGLQYGVRNYMGLQRDLVYRNKLLTDTILSPLHLNIYQWIVFVGLIFSLVVYIRRKSKQSRYSYSSRYRNNSYENKLNKVLILISLISILWLSMVFYYPKSTWLAYPWIILTVLTMIVVQYIRLIYLYFKQS